MTWKKAVIVIAILFGGAIGRTAALGTNAAEAASCWGDYVDFVVQSADQYQACMKSLMFFGALGSEWCGLIYFEETEWAFSRYLACLVGMVI